MSFALAAIVRKIGAVPSAAEQLSLFANQPKPDSDESGFSVRVSGRAKRISIKVYPRGRVEVVAPRRARARDVEAFVAEHRDWIDRTRHAFAKDVPPESLDPPKALHLPAANVAVDIVYRQEPGLDRVRVRRYGNTLVLRGPIDNREQCINALQRWLKALAKRVFEPQLKSLSHLTGNAYKRVQIRGQKTCWGSHSSNGTISLNYSLLFLAPELLRYLLIHELCHARHMNHSPSYWRHVEKFEPNYRELDRRLSEGWRDVPAWLGIH